MVDNDETSDCSDEEGANTDVIEFNHKTGYLFCILLKKKYIC